MSVRSWPGYDDDEEDCSASLRSQSPARSLLEGRRRVLDDMASDLSWSDLASDIMSESGTASSHQLIALRQLVQGRLVSEPALRARVVSKLCADGEVQQAAQDAEDAALGILVDIAVGLPCWRVATIRIQSAARGCAARRKLLAQRGARAAWAATGLQRVWRGRCARRAWRRVQRSVRLLQATERRLRRRPLVRLMRRRARAAAAQLAVARAEAAALRLELATSEAPTLCLSLTLSLGLGSGLGLGFGLG